MICSVTCLNSGYNGGGHSTLVSFEHEGPSVTADRAILSRCLVNVGDGTQRFCNENRGVGNITVIGPPGIKSSIDLMLPFTNRKYPVLDIHEIDQTSSGDSLTIRTEQLTYNIYPVYSSKDCSRVMAIGASIHLNHFEGAKFRSNDLVSVFPIPYYFESHPAIADLVESTHEYGLATFKKKANNLYLFVPMAVSSFEATTDADFNAPESHTSHFNKLQDLCEKYEANGIMATGNLSSTQFEFTHAQSMLTVLNSLCKPIFPEVAPSLKNAYSMETKVSGVLQFASPMLTVGCGTADTTDNTYLLSSVNRVRQRNALTSELYRTAVLPRLQDILSTQPHASSTYTGPPPPPAPPVPLPMPLHKRAQSELSALPYPLLPAAVSRGNSAPMITHSSSLNILTDMSSLSEPYHSAADTFSSLASDEPSELGTPSPQSNFGAASALREKLLAKRKLSTFSSSLPTGSNIGIGFEADNAPSSLTEGMLKSCAGSEKSRTIQPAEEEEVSTTPLKSLRLNDSSKFRFTFTAIEENSQTSQCAPSEVSSAPTNHNFETKGSFDLQRVQQQESFARIAFSVPPPNPFGDICTVTFLGTGSATPSKYRNGSCIMLSLNNNQASSKRSFANPFAESEPSPPPVVPAKKQIVLLDCGEGTATQMFQSVASDIQRFDEILLNIKIIWISHHHADHITGVPMLLEQIKRAQLRREAAAALATHRGELPEEHATGNNNSRHSMRRVHTVSKYDMRSMFSSGGYEAGKVMIIGSEAVLKYFEFSACVAGLDDLVTFLPIVNTLYAGATVEIAAATDGVLTRLRSIPVQHCHSSYGLVLDFQSHHKIVYSGDCRPSQSLVKAGIDCDLLIHEATFDDSKQEDAVKKRHSTSSEARRMAVQMHAKHTVLTHFSQRYPLEASSALQTLVDPFSGSEGYMGYAPPPPQISQSHCAAVAYDFLKFSFPSQASALPKVTAALGSVLTALEEERRRIKQTVGSAHLS
eukprot:gene15732-17979_t